MSAVSPRSLPVIFLLIALAVVVAAFAVRNLHRGRSVRAGVAVVLASVLLLSAVGVSLNRTIYHKSSWATVAKNILLPPAAGTGTGEPIPFAPRSPLWEGKPDPRYTVKYAPITPAHVKNPRGEFYTITFTGPESGIRLETTVWAPKAWRAMKELAVIEILPGYPGAPPAIPHQINVDGVMTSAINAGRIAPTMVVIPHVNADKAEPDALDLPGRPKIGSWVARDIPAMVLANFPASTDPAKWTLAGMSAGGYNAPAIAAYTPDTFGNAMSFSGTDLPNLGGLKHLTPELQAKYSVSELVRRAPDLNVWAFATGSDPLSAEAVAGLAAVAPGRTGSTYLVYSLGEFHKWAIWGKHFPQAVDWLGKTLAGEKVSRTALPGFVANTYRNVPRNMWPIYAVVGLVVLAGVGLLAWRFRARRPGTVLGRMKGHAPANVSDRERAGQTQVQHSGSRSARAGVILDVVAVTVAIVGLTLVWMVLANLQLDLVRSPQNLGRLWDGLKIFETVHRVG